MATTMTVGQDFGGLLADRERCARQSVQADRKRSGAFDLRRAYRGVRFCYGCIYSR